MSIPYTVTSRTRPLLTGVALVAALAVSACSGPSEESTAPESTATENEELPAEDEEIAGGEPETGLLGEEYQPTVDCLQEAGAAPEDYTVDRLETDLHGHFQDSDVDLSAPEFDECLALSEIEFEVEEEN